MSVVLPCHGSLPYIQETVDSLIHQTFSEFEVIVVNDRIAYEDIDYVKELSRLDSRFRVVDSYGHGISAALNTGISHTNSNFIARIDADDIMDLLRLEIQHQEITLRKEVLCVGSQLKIINEFGKLIRHTNFPEYCDQIREMMTLRNVVAHPSVLFRKDAFLKVGSYRSFFDGAEDYDLWLRLIKSGEIVNLHESLTSYRIHSAQETRKNREIQQKMDSVTRFYAVIEPEISIMMGPNTLKSIVSSEMFKSADLVKNSLLPQRVKKSLLGAQYLNAAMSNPNFVNLLGAIYVLGSRPKLFFLAVKYLCSRLAYVSG